MKITKSQLEQIISEEISTLSEEENLDEVFGYLKKKLGQFMGGGRGPKASPSDTKKMAGFSLSKQSVADLMNAGAKDGDPKELYKALNQVFKSLEEAGVEAKLLRPVRKVAFEELIKFNAISGEKKRTPTQKLSPEEIAQGIPGEDPSKAKDQTRDELMKDYKKRLDALKEGKKGESAIRTSKLLKEGIEDLRKQITNLVDKVKSGEMEFKLALQTYATALTMFINSTLLPNTKKPGKVAEPEAAPEEKPPAEEKPAAGKPSGEEEKPAAAEKPAEETPAPESDRKSPPGLDKPGKGRIAISHAVGNALGGDFKGDKNKIIKLIRDRFKRYANKQLGGLGNLVLTEQQMDDFARGFYRELRKMSALGNMLTNRQLAKIAQNLGMQVANNPDKGLAGKPEAKDDGGDKEGATPGVVTPEEAEAIVDATAKRTGYLARSKENREKMVSTVRKKGEEGVEYLKNTGKLPKADPEDVVAAQAKRSKTLRGKSKEQQDKMVKGVKKKGDEAIKSLKNTKPPKLDEAFNDRGERIYEALMKKFIK